MMLYVLLALCVGCLVSANARRYRNKQIDTLIRKSAKYATTAQQDASPLVATVHANTAAGYLYALRDISSTEDIHGATGIDFKKFQQHILAVQDMVTKKTLEACPSFRGEIDLYLSTIGGS